MKGKLALLLAVLCVVGMAFSHTFPETERISCS